MAQIYDGRSENALRLTLSRIQLDGITIGTIYGQSDNYYANTRTLDYNISAYFSTIEDGQNWLVETYYSLTNRPIEIFEYNQIYQIYHIYRGGSWIGEYRYYPTEEKQNWSATHYSQPINGITHVSCENFTRKADAIEFILNSDFALHTQLQIYLVSLESEKGFNTVKVQANPETIDWNDWLADYDRVTGFEHSIISKTEIN